MSEGHHIVPQQRIKIARSAVAVKRKRGDHLTLAEERLVDTPLSAILRDPRNVVKLSRAQHHRAHHFERLREDQLPAGIHDFAEHYALEWALDRELELIRS